MEKCLRFTLFLLHVVCFTEQGQFYRQQTVYQKLSQEKNLSDFYTKIQSSKDAKINLFYRSVTVLAPNNAAMQKFQGNMDKTILYHLIHDSKSLEDISRRLSLTSVLSDAPPLWITKRQDDIYVNNAKIIGSSSDFLSRNGVDDTGKNQALHVIDEVLRPFAVGPEIDALTLLQNDMSWNLGPFSLEKYRKRIDQLKLREMLRKPGSNTYFFPVDSDDDFQFNMIDICVAQAHVINFNVLFTRPTPKFFNYETSANSGYTYVTAMFSTKGNETFVSSNTVYADSNHPIGEVTAKIVRADIPVSNGVVHLISRPLMLKDKPLRKFPYLPIYDKLASDPNLNITFTLGEWTGFNHQLKSGPVKFTLFAPSDKAWDRLGRLIDTDTIFKKEFKIQALDILNRHLVVSETTYSMKYLLKASRYNSEIVLDTPSVPVVVRVKEDEKYLLKWRNKTIGVYKSDYECTNGLVHIIDDLFLNEEDLERLGVQSTSRKLYHWFSLLTRF